MAFLSSPFAAARSPMSWCIRYELASNSGGFGGVLLSKRQFGKYFERRFIISRFKQRPRNRSTKFERRFGREYATGTTPHNGELPVFERLADLFLRADHAGACRQIGWNRFCGLRSGRSRITTLGGEKCQGKVRGRSIASFQLRGELLDFLSQALGKLFEGSISEPTFSNAEDPFGL